MYFVNDDNRIDEHRQEAGRTISVVEERKELIDGSRENPLRPVGDGEEAGIHIKTFVLAFVSLPRILEHAVEFISAGSVNQRRVSLRGP